MITSKETLKGWFKRGLKPLEAQFNEWFDAYWHKDEKIELNVIEGLSEALNSKVSDAEIEALHNEIDAEIETLRNDLLNIDTSPERRHAFEFPYDYCGTAIKNSSEDDEIWTITRIEITHGSVVRNIKIAHDASWSERLTGDYN